MFGVRGVVDGWLATLGWPNAPAFISDPRFAMYTLVLLGLWQFGAPMVIFLAGLRQIPRDLYEAARVDGANAFARFWRITVPLLTPPYCSTWCCK
jgi:multiple sugar transport system permease protein